MRQRLLLLLLGLFIAILIVIANQGTVAPGRLSSEDFSSLAYKIGILVFVAGTLLTLFRERFAQAVTMAMLWVIVGMLLVVGYSYRFELRQIADRVLADLIPGRVISQGRTVAVARTNGGDFAINAQINGARVAMMLDTGASSVVLTPRGRQGRRSANRGSRLLGQYRHRQRPRPRCAGDARTRGGRQLGRALR